MCKAVIFVGLTVYLPIFLKYSMGHIFYADTCKAADCSQTLNCVLTTVHMPWEILKMLGWIIQPWASKLNIWVQYYRHNYKLISYLHSSTCRVKCTTNRDLSHLQFFFPCEILAIASSTLKSCIIVWQVLLTTICHTEIHVLVCKCTKIVDCHSKTYKRCVRKGLWKKVFNG